MIAWLRKHWFMVPTIIIVVSFIYGYAQHEANQDSVADTCLAEVAEIKETQDCLEEDMQYLKEQAAIQREFYKLMRPDLWEAAEERVNNNDST